MTGSLAEVIADRIEPEIRRQVDALIEEERDLEVRRALMHDRERVIAMLVDRNVAISLEHRLRELEAGLKPRLVEDETLPDHR